jgi:N-acetylneuraminic acid mutarotase
LFVKKVSLLTALTKFSQLVENCFHVPSCDVSRGTEKHSRKISSFHEYKKNFASTLIVIALIALCAVIVQPVLASENSWATRADIPSKNEGCKAASVNGKIYVIGNDTNYEYNPTTDVWINKKPVPTPRSNFGLVACQDKIYVIGGVTYWNIDNGAITTCSLNEVYDPLTDTWETKASMPTNRAYMEANAVDGKIYVVGGRTGQGYTTVNLHEVYDVASDSWTAKASIPYAVVKYASAVVDNKIYAIGGQDEFLHENMNVVFNQIYDTVTDAWSQGAQIPVAALSAVAGATTGEIAPKKVYVLGGYEDFMIPLDKNYVYDPEKDSWSLGAPMTTARYGLALAVENDLLYAIGGVAGWRNVTKTVEQYTPVGYGTIGSPSPSSTSSSMQTPALSPSRPPASSVVPSASEQPSRSPERTPRFPIEYCYIIAVVVAIALIAITALILKRRK